MCATFWKICYWELIQSLSLENTYRKKFKKYFKVPLWKVKVDLVRFFKVEIFKLIFLNAFSMYSSVFKLVLWFYLCIWIKFIYFYYYLWTFLKVHFIKLRIELAITIFFSFRCIMIFFSLKLFNILLLSLRLSTRLLRMIQKNITMLPVGQESFQSLNAFSLH